MKFLFCIGFIILYLFSFSVIYGQQKQADGDSDYQKNVKNLPTVDKVEILAIEWMMSVKRENIDCTQSDIVCSNFPGKILASKTLTGEEAKKISNLWRSLKNGNGAGCFAPAYVLRFYKEDKLLLMTDVCFHCCNITLPGTGIRSICGSEQAFENFKEAVTTELPFPKREREK